MEPKPLLRPNLIQLLRFQIIRGQIESPMEFQEDLVQGHSFSVDFDMSFQLKEKLVKADFKVEIQTTGEEQVVEAKGQFHFVFLFQVGNLEELVQVAEQNKLQVSSELGNALASITYSTSRGILLTRFQGTGLESFILPVINPNELLEKEA